jgi:hypothetical protein
MRKTKTKKDPRHVFRLQAPARYIDEIINRLCLLEGDLESYDPKIL